MNLGLSLISAVIESGDMKAVAAEGLSADYFDPESAMYWETLTEHYEEFSEVPSVEFFKELHPSYVHVKTRDSIAALSQDLKTQKLARDIHKGLLTVSKMNGSDPWKARELLTQLTEKILHSNSSTKEDFYMGEDYEMMVDDLKRARDGGGIVGMHWPYEVFNRNSTGIMPGDVTYIYGQQKHGKTWVNLQIALYYVEKGYRVLLFARDTLYEQMKWRAAAMKLRANISKLPKAQTSEGSMTDEYIEHIGSVMKELSESKRLIITEACDGLVGFKAKIEQYAPDIVIHDYLKALSEDLMGDKVLNEHAYIAKAVNAVVKYAKKTKIPMFLTGHANRENTKSGRGSDTNHAGSSQIARRCDCVINVTLDIDQGGTRQAIVVNAGRSIPIGIGFTQKFDLCESYGELISTDYSWASGEDKDGDISEQQRKSKHKQAQAEKLIGGFSANDFS